MLILPDDVNGAVQQSANDIAAALQRVKEFAWIIGGEKMIYKAMQEVTKLEFYGMSALEACHTVYSQIADDNL